MQRISMELRRIKNIREKNRSCKRNGEKERPRRGEACAAVRVRSAATPLSWATAAAASVHLSTPCVLSLFSHSLCDKQTTGWATAAAALHQVLNPSPATSTHQIFPPFLFPASCAKPTSQTLT
jgi:hypothetical protein